MRTLIPAIVSTLLAAVALGCAGASQSNSTRNAESLRSRLPRILEEEPSRAPALAAAAQERAPTSAGKWLLLRADSEFEGVSHVFRLGSPSPLAAIRTGAAIVTSDADRRLQIWSADSGAPLATRSTPTPIIRFAQSYSPFLIASVDTAGRIALWNLEDTSKPSSFLLARLPTPGHDIVGLQFLESSTRLLAVTRTGQLYVFNVLSHRLLGRKLLRDLPGDSSWDANRRSIEVTAATASNEEFAVDENRLLVATRADGVDGVDIRSNRVSTEVPSHEIPSEVTALAEYATPSRSIAIGTTTGAILWSPIKHYILTETSSAEVTGFGYQSPIMAAGSGKGLSSADLLHAEESGAQFSRFKGRAVRDLTEGPGGPLAIDSDGTVSVLNAAAGIRLPTNESEAGLITDFGPEGNLLEIEGSNPNEVDELTLVKPGVAGPEGSENEPNAVVRRLMPSKTWWPEQNDTPRGLFIDSAEVDREFVAAGGQDPTGAAVVLVWNTRTGKPVQRLALVQSAVAAKGLTEIPSIVSGVTLLAHRHLLAAYSVAQQLIVVWSTEDWKKVATIDVGPISSFAVSPDEKTFIVDSLSDKESELNAGNGHTRLLSIDVTSGETVGSMVAEGARFALYLESGDLLTMSKGGVIEQLSKNGRHELKPPIQEEHGPATAIAVEPKSDVLAFATNTGTYLVDLGTGAVSEALPVSESAEPVSLSFDPTEPYLVGSYTAHSGQAVEARAPIIWNLGNETLEKRACTVTGAPPPRAEWRRWTFGLSVREPCRG